MRKTETEDTMIDALLRDVADVSPEPDAGLMARVLADAARAPSLPSPPPVRGLWAQLGDAIGGWPAVGGLALAGCVGLWIGVAPPAPVEDMAATLMGTTETVSMWNTDALADEVFADG